MRLFDGMSATERKQYPIYLGALRYFPDAIAYVAHVSKVANDQHNPGQPMHWARGKSMDQEDALVRHLMDTGTTDEDGLLHAGKVAWRALAILQLELEGRFNAKLDAEINEAFFKGTPFDPATGAGGPEAIEGPETPLEAEDAVDGLAGSSSGHPELGDLVEDEEDDETEWALADAYKGVEEIEEVPDGDRTPKWDYQPATMVRRTSEDTPQWVPFTVRARG